MQPFAFALFAGKLPVCSRSNPMDILTLRNCAKSRLVGKYIEPAAERGSHTPLLDRNEAVGTVLRTRSSVKPLFVSPGHLITIDEAAAIVLRTTAGFRLPEPQREADRFAAEIKRKLLSGEA